MKNTCCFIGHRNIGQTEKLENILTEIIENLILCKKINTFLFGSKSEFNRLCYKKVTESKKKFPHIKRVFVRAEYPFINDDYKEYLLGIYEDTYYPDNILKAGRAVYVERNFEMIRDSSVCVFYYKDDYRVQGRKSGTKIAYDYAVRLNKEIIRVK